MSDVLRSFLLSSQRFLRGLLQLSSNFFAKNWIVWKRSPSIVNNLTTIWCAINVSQKLSRPLTFNLLWRIEIPLLCSIGEYYIWRGTVALGSLHINAFLGTVPEVTLELFANFWRCISWHCTWSCTWYRVIVLEGFNILQLYSVCIPNTFGVVLDILHISHIAFLGTALVVTLDLFAYFRKCFSWSSMRWLCSNKVLDFTLCNICLYIS